MSQSIFKTFYYSKWFLLAVFVLIIFFSVSAVQDYYSQEDLRDDITMLEAQIGQLEVAQSDLISSLAQVQSDDFVETEARSKLNLRKPGEQVIIVSSENDVQKFNELTEGAGIKNLLRETESNAQKWWQYFFPRT